MQCASYSAEQLKDALKNCTTFVALNNSEKLMGMLSVEFREINRWWHKGMAAYICFVAVAPEYKRQGVYRALSLAAIKEIREQHISVEYLHTHIHNYHARKIYERDGYRLVHFMPGEGTNYYSVEMAKWIAGRGWNPIVCHIMYTVTSIVGRLIYKPGKIRRF